MGRNIAKNGPVPLASIAFGLSTATTVIAQPLCYEVTINGTVSSLSAIPSLQSAVDSAFGVNDPFTLIVAYDGASPVTGGAANTDEYDGAIISLTGSIGGYSFGGAGTATSQIQLRNSSGFNTTFGDHFYIRINEESIGPDVGTAFPYFLGIVLTDTSDSIFPGFPGLPPLTTDFDFSGFDTFAGAGMSFLDLVAQDDGAINVNFDITSWSSQAGCDSGCIADLSGDGILDNGDIGAFVSLFLAGDLAADFTGDGILDNGDIGAFVAAFLAGC